MHHRKAPLIQYEEIQVVFTMSFCKGIHNMKMEYFHIIIHIHKIIYIHKNLDKLILVVSVE